MSNNTELNKENTQHEQRKSYIIKISDCKKLNFGTSAQSIDFQSRRKIQSHVRLKLCALKKR